MNHKILLPNRCREGLQGLKSPVFTGFFRPLELFPLAPVSHILNGFAYEI